MAINSADVKHEVIRYMNNLARETGTRMDWIRVNEFGSRYRYVFSDPITIKTIVEYEIEFKEVDDIFDCVYEIKENLKNKLVDYNLGIKSAKHLLNSTYGSTAFKHVASFTMPIPELMNIKKRGSLPEIKDVIFNDPATIIFWQDGDKTVVKAQEGDTYDAEKGLAMAIVKKAYGNKGNYCEKLKEWLEVYEAKQEIISPLARAMCDALNKLSEQANETANSLKPKKRSR